MITRNRRFGFRVPLEIFLDQYAGERRLRALTTDVSETGLFVETVKSRTTGGGDTERVTMEFQLPGMKESIWASGEICYERDGAMVTGAGIRFVAMARGHARALRDFCIEQRRHQLSGLLAGLQRDSALAA